MANSYLNRDGVLYLWQKIKNYVASVMPTKQSDLVNDDYTVKDVEYSTYKGKIDSLEDRVDDIVTQGGEPNILETVKVNGTALVNTNKAVDLSVVSGTQNGSIAVNGSDVMVSGLGTAAFTNSNTYDVAGAATAVLGTSQDAAGTATVYGALASAVAAQNGVNTINSMGYQTASQVESTVESYGYQTEQQVQAAVGNAVGVINAMGYQTASQVQSTIESYDYQTESEVEAAIASALDGVTGISYEVVQTLPQSGEAGVIYLIANNGNNPNIYDEYIYLPTQAKFEKIGTTDVDLSGYMLKNDMVVITNAEIDTIVNGSGS